MKLALIFFAVLTSLSFGFGAQEMQPSVCRGKPLPIALLPGPKMSGPSLPLRFGGTREFPRPPIHSFLTEKGFRLVIKNRAEFADFWKRFTGQINPSNGTLPIPEVDFSKELVVVAAMGQRPSSGYWTFIDGACEVDGQVEVFISNVEAGDCGATLGVVTYPADAVRLPQTDLPIVFRETQVGCREWRDRFLHFPRG
jgi:hypothetical protein